MGAAVTTYAYNNRNLVEKVIDADGYESFTYYNEEDMPFVTVDGEGRKTHTRYDVLHRPTKEIRAWTGLDDGTGAELDCGVMRGLYNPDPDPNLRYLQQCYREMEYTPVSVALKAGFPTTSLRS